MRSDDLDVRELLDVDPVAGTVRFAGRPALIVDAVALGLLRRQLVDTVGAPVARAVATRFGYAHGWRLADAMRAELPDATDAERRAAGGRLHVLQGLIRLSPDAGDPFQPGGATLVGSFEAEQHRLHFGPADAPVCWAAGGTASGYLSRVEGREIFVLEDRCMAMGHPTCRFRARTREEWGPELDAHLPWYQGSELHGPIAGLLDALERADRRITRKVRRMAEPPADRTARSAAMQGALDLARRVAAVDATVVLVGESGVGKERMARLIHETSARAKRPFLAVNCGAIHEALLESELFGHARGAFTGAVGDRIGLLEAVDGGTLLLDEVGELPPGVQVKLLRALQEREVRRVGENRSRRFDARILAATHRDLADDVATGRFRKDLYYRLQVVELRVPPLRERRDDILPLARQLLAQAARSMGRPAPALTPRAADQLVRHAWPGNVRELENAMARAVALAEGRRVDLEDLPEDVRRAPPALPASDVRTLDDVALEYALAALDRNGGHQARTAEQLGIGVSTLYRMLKRRPGRDADPAAAGLSSRPEVPCRRGGPGR